MRAPGRENLRKLAGPAAILLTGAALAGRLELAARLLPEPSTDGDGEEARPGWQSTSRWVPSLLTRLADEAAVENNELRGAAVESGGNGNGREGR